jgi:hypothetical protein
VDHRQRSFAFVPTQVTTCDEINGGRLDLFEIIVSLLSLEREIFSLYYFSAVNE